MIWPYVSGKIEESQHKNPQRQTLISNLCREGIIFKSASTSADNWLVQPLVFGGQADLVALLGQLEEEGFAQWQENRLLLSWPAFYELLGSPDYSESLSLLRLPPVEAWRPVLNSRGSLNDPDFAITQAGWISPSGNHHQGTTPKTTGARLEVGTNHILLPQYSWETIAAVTDFYQRSPEERSPEANKRGWARIRRLALQAHADLSDFLRKTIVLTPDRLNIGLRKVQFGDSKTVEVLPGFDGAPDGWLDAFDRLSDVHDRYQIAEGEGLVHVLLSPEVQTVLREVKRLPGRRISGERAEAFVRNPFATLGPDAIQVIDPVQFEQAREQAGISYARFIAKERRDQGGDLIGAGLLINECVQGTLRSDELPFNDIGEIEEFVRKLDTKIKRGAQCCIWKGYELEILGDTLDQLTLLQGVLDELRRPPKINLDELFDLSRYSERIEGFGVEKPYYSPFITRKDKDSGWFPENIETVVIYTPEGTTEPIAVTLAEETLEYLSADVHRAQEKGDETVVLPGCPVPLKVTEAEGLINTFREARRDIASGTFNPGPQKRSVPPKEIKKLVIKANVAQVDHHEQRGRLRSSKEIFPYTLPKSLKEDVYLKEHQLQGLGWLQYLWSQSPRFCRGGILADDMGLGKTLQLLSFIIVCLETDSSIDPFLVVAPVSLLENWQEEIDRFFIAESIPILTLYGNELSKKMLPKERVMYQGSEVDVGRLLRADWLGSAKLVLTTYETLRDMEFSLAGQQWSAIICDEAQKIKNPNAMVTRASKKQNARLKIACTGTPVENTLTDLWCLFDFVQPGLLGALNTFSTHYRKPIEAEDDEEKAKVQELRTIIEPQIMRRLKAEVAKDLPRKEEVEDCRNLILSDYQRNLYAQAIQQFRSHSPEGSSISGQNSLRLLQYLRRLCSDPRPPGQMAVEGESLTELESRSPKIAWLMRTLATIKSKGEKAILFCEFRDLQRTLQRAISERFALTPDMINGDTSTKTNSSSNRQTRLKRFQSKEGFGVIILSPLAVGFGVNIQAANHVIHFTRTWNPAKEDQATDRAYRIGQTKDVFVYYPVITAHDFTTFDAKLDKLLSWKRSLSDDMLKGAGDLLPSDFGDLENIDGTNAFTNELVSFEEVMAMTPSAFEVFCAALWSAHGYSKVYKTPDSGDGGIDVVAIKGNNGVLIQCKSSSLDGQELGWEAIKDVVAGAAAYSARHPGVSFKRIACTNQRFNKIAWLQAKVNHVELVDRDDLSRMLEEKNIKRLDLEWFQISDGRGFV
jgi:SNF2 family DNA or RNA helicase